MFTLDQIRCFVSVAEELHFGRAAERLQMTQPPLSRQIQKLERSLQVTLLNRDHRNVELTAAGRAFLAESRELLAAADRAPAAARSIASGQEGVVRIGFTAAAGFGVLGEVLTAISEALPRITLELSELVSRQQAAALLEGSLDLGLARPPFDAETFESHLLLAEDLVLAVPSGHPLAEVRGGIGEQDLRGIPLIMHSPLTARYFYDLIVRLFPVDHGQVVHTVGQITTMVALVRAGRGVAFVPASARLLGVDGVQYLDLSERARGTVQLHLIWNQRNANPAMQRVLELLDAGGEW
ncbi:LysR family transcriptional regulator [Citricoccus sp.]|uniref:LysR family transcriptional regulator n=1 Tax=Citricoccus sp. TaxID=1978372 RepID=UPI002631732F|nr:LysR family transcriptional regulator [Citricoccus sp.]HRO30665.1 LysR family transcriptional regulator [Citricoccus sp.]HRO94234.1 LysR family transcriptional regulator [Citricoccus sp.]